MQALTRKKYAITFVLALSLGGLVLLAGGVKGLQLQAGKPLNLLEWFLARLESAFPPHSLKFTGNPSSAAFSQEIGAGVLQLVIISFWLCLIFSILYAIISPEFRKELFRGLLLILVLVWLLPLIAENIRQSRDRLEGGGEVPGGFIAEAPSLPDPPQFIQDPPDWLFTLVNGLLLMAISGGAYVIWRRFQPKPDAQSVFVKEISRALNDLDRGRALNNVVITCYAQMCAGLAKSRRMARHQAMTPREFEAHLAKAGIADSHIHQLTRLFERVRYGAQPPDAYIEREARECLATILQVYES